MLDTLWIKPPLCLVEIVAPSFPSEMLCSFERDGSVFTKVGEKFAANSQKDVC